MTQELFRTDSYLKQCDAVVMAVNESYLELDQTVFYPLGGGQPGDTGALVRDNGEKVNIVDTTKDPQSGIIWHHLEQGAALTPSETVSAEIDWPRRHRIMRLHSCMHMLCALVPAPVTGGSIGDQGSARLDFNLPNPIDKIELNQKLNALTSSDNAMTMSWISEDEMKAQPELVRTMSVQPPMGSGKVRLVKFNEIDLQPCGGTHVANSNEIGAVLIQSIKKKGKQNRRITVSLV